MDIRELLDSLTHIGIYVVDSETLVTCYENPTAQKYSVKYRIGQPCYHIHGNTSMCSSCPIRRTDHLSYVNRTDLNMVFVMRAEKIRWEGHDAWMISVARQGDYMTDSVEERSIKRMSRALQKSVDVYTEINMDTLQYRQINLHGADCFNIESTGDYASAYEHMCREEIHPDDADEVRRIMAPERMQNISADSDGAKELAVRYRLKNVTPTRIMESRAIFMRDELPHYVVSIARDVTEETMLREQANTLESILSNVSCGVAIYDIAEDGTISMEYFNDGLCVMTEYPREALAKELEQNTFFTVNQPYQEAVKHAFLQVREGRDTASAVCQSTTFTGKQIWVRLALSATRDEKHALRVYGTFFDITAETEVQQEVQKRYELERKRSQDDESILAYAVFDLQAGTTLEMERRRPFLALEEKMELDAFSNDIAASIPNDEKRAEFLQLFSPKYLLEAHQGGIDEHSLEYQRRLPGGKIIWVKSSFHLIADSSKNEIMLFYYCNDINVAKSLELMTSYMVNTDYDMLGCVNFADDTAIMLYGQNSSRRGHGMAEIQVQERYSESLEWFVKHGIVPEERKHYHEKAFVSEIREALSQNENYEFVLHVQDPDRGIRTKQIRYTRYDEESAICFFSQTDITDMLAEEEKKQDKLRAALLEAKQANAAKTDFLSRMSHDMRTPMNGVLGLAALMRDEQNLSEIRADLTQLELSGKYLLQLINDTLDVSKIEAGKMELRMKPVDTELIFGNVLSNAGYMAKEKGVRLKITGAESGHEKKPGTESGSGRLLVLADAARLEQVVMNVLSNAIKFTPKGGLVEILLERVSVTDQEVTDRYTIRDNGIGIGEEFLPHIFDAFAQEGRMNTNRESGTGLGMSIVKQLVELMDGRIEIQSKVNEGTEVTLELHYQRCLEEWKEQDQAKVSLSALRGKRVLLCEDHPLNAQIARRLLEKEGMVVERAENGQLGVDRFRDFAPGHFDVILMDIRMPVLNGLEAAKAIRALNRADAKTIPIIAMTANAFDDDVQDCLAAGMNAHVAKPIEPQGLYQEIAKWI